MDELTSRIWTLRGRDLTRLHIEPTEILLKVPFFKEIPPQEIDRVIEYLRPLSLTENQVIISQGERGESLFLIGRGVIRVCRESRGKEEELATLIAGDFFGEMALLHNEPRTATCRTVTPCVLYELHSDDINELAEANSSIHAALEEADLARSGMDK